jgi:hypothetical protein
MQAVEEWMITSGNSINALYDNSRPFMNFLKNQGLDSILRRTKLKLRERHTVVPHVRVTH